MQTSKLEQTIFNFLILGISRLLPKKFYKINYRFDKISPVLQKLKSLGQYLEVLFAICDNFETVLAAFKCSWAHFNCCRWENTKKYKWAIWSHWIGGSVDLSALTKLRSWVRIPSRPSCFNISQILCCLCHWVENWTKVNKNRSGLAHIKKKL